MRQTLVFLVFVASLQGCLFRPRPFTYAEPAAFRGVKTVRLVDTTSPVLLRSAHAETVAELLRVGFEGNGYSVCSEPDCAADAMGTVQTTVYERRERSKMHWTGFPLMATYSTVAFRVDLKRADGEPLLALEQNRQDTFPLEPLAGQCVQEIMDYYVPKCSP